MSERRARCHCGQLELVCEGEPRKVSMCHCLDCQRRTGSLFSAAAFYSRDGVQVLTGKTSTFERLSANGDAVVFHFCAKCGSNLFWTPARMPDLVGVAAGAFADPAFPAPDQSVWTKHRHRWLSLPADLPCFASNPPSRA